MQTILMIGLGKIGLEVAKQLTQQGSRVVGVSRSLPKLPDNMLSHFSHIRADARLLEATAIAEWIDCITQLCIIVSPDAGTEQAYYDSYYAISENILRLSKDLPKLQRVIFISSTGVYGQNSAETIDSSVVPQQPTSLTSAVILKTERLLQQGFKDKCVIIRPSGIYGVERLRLINLARKIANDDTAVPSNTWTNRIFDTDLVQVIVNVINTERPLPVYLVTDNESIPLYTVLNYLAQQQGLTLLLDSQPPLTGKRIVHNIPNEWLAYPSYQSGYQRILKSLEQIPKSI